MKPGVLILTGYGINCDEETRYAFERSGARADIVHVNDLIASPGMLADYNIFVFPGGFSYGDDTGSGKALSNRIRNNLSEELGSFIERDTLVLGICNGFQVMVNLGLVPAIGEPFGTVEASLEHNKSFRYQCRWVDLKVDVDSPCVFTRGVEYMHIPVAHGEGNFYAPESVIDVIEKEHLSVMKYVKPDGSSASGSFPANPNGSLNDIAALCSRSGRVMGMMPHPERGMLFTQRDDWTLKREELRRKGQPVPEESDGMIIFKNAVSYFE